MEYAQSLMRHLAGDDVNIGKAPLEIEAWLESLAMPTDLKRMLQWSWPSVPVTVGNVEFTDPIGMFHFDHRDELIRSHLFPLGHGLNGDPFLIDLSGQSQTVGFISLDEFPDATTIRDVFQPAFRTLASYLHRVTRQIPSNIVNADSAFDRRRGRTMP